MPTPLPEAGAPDVLYLIDLSGYVFRAFHAISHTLTSPTGEPTNATLGTVTMIQRLIGERRPALLGVTMDSVGPTFRTALDPRYKAHRPAPAPELSLQMKRIGEIIEAYRMPVLQNEGFEADDVIATAVRVAREHRLRVVIVSADKDLMQLVGDDVVLWDTMRNKVYGAPEVREKFGVGPAQMRDLLALTGDTSDNIPGVPHIGPKRASELLCAYDTLDGVFASLASIKAKAVRETLTANEAEARLSQRLVTLRDDVAIACAPEELRPGQPNADRLRVIFTELGFGRLLAQLDTGASLSANRSANPAPAPGRDRSYRAVTSEDDLAAFVVEACRAPVVAIDTETTSVDATRAELLGISLAFRTGEGVYVPLGHQYEGAPPQLPLDTVRRVLGPLFAKGGPMLAGHNLKYDDEILRRHGFDREGPCFDTMLASYLLDPEAQHGLKELAQRELGLVMTTYDQVTEKQRGKQLAFSAVTVEAAAQYAGADALVTLELYERYAPRVEGEGLASLLREVELPLMRVLEDLELGGVLVDASALGKIGATLTTKLCDIEAKAKALAGREINVSAPRQLETLLFDELKLPVIKRTKTARSTDAEVLEALADHHPLPAAILEHRQLAKLKNTYVDTLPTLINEATGRIHARFNQAVAATGRLSSSDPNLQNIPIRSEIGRSIRSAFVAPPGRVIVSADYSQIELRVLAHLSHDAELVDAFRARADVHARTAALIFGVAASDVDGEMRRVAKTINFGVIYGMGDSALAKRLGISREKAAGFIAAYFERYAGVRTYFDTVLDEARGSGAVTTMLGRRRFVPDLSSANRALRLQAERIAQNTPIQGTSADILKLAMVKLGSAPVVPDARMILTVHDELVFEIPSDLVSEASEKIRSAMECVLTLDVPLVVEVGHGHNWAEAHA